MDAGIVFYVVGALVVLLLFASRFERRRNKDFSKLLLFIALAILAGAMISWTLQAISYIQ